MSQYLKRIRRLGRGKPVIKRPLTLSEVAMAKQVFAEALNYDTIYLYNAPFLPFGLQSDHTVMAPNGNIYFPQRLYTSDYSDAAARKARFRHLFIHEMVHVWQYQMGYRVKLKGAILHPWGKLTMRSPYHYELDTSKKLCDYNMEQQADIIADYYALSIDTSSYVHKSNSILTFINEHGEGCAKDILQDYVLRDFLADPSQKLCLFK